MKRFLPTMLTAFLLAPVSSVGADLGQIYNIIQVSDDGTVPAVSMQAPMPTSGSGIMPMHMPMGI